MVGAIMAYQIQFFRILEIIVPPQRDTLAYPSAFRVRSDYPWARGGGLPSPRTIYICSLLARPFGSLLLQPIVSLLLRLFQSILRRHSSSQGSLDGGL